MIKPLIITGGPADWALPEFLEQISDWIHAPHLVSPTTLGSLEASSHKADGTAFFGTGNSTDHYIHLFDHTSNIEFGLEDHYRTGAYVDPVKDTAGNFSATMDLDTRRKVCTTSNTPRPIARPPQSIYR